MDFEEFNKLLKNQLAHMLMSEFSDKKDLALDADLTRPLDRVAGVSFLKQHGVDKIFKLEPGQKSLPGINPRIYLVRPRLLTMKYIADHINTEKSKGEDKKYKIVMVPRKLYKCENILETEGVMGHVTIDEFPMELLPLDTDILSLELPDFFKSFYLENDTTWLHTVASSLLNIQRLFGRIPNVYQMGTGADMVHELMLRMFDCHRAPDPDKYSIGQLFIVGRDVDYVSPLCSPMTYEGLLDETFGIDCCTIDFGADITGDSKSSKQLLTNKEEIYSQIRDTHFAHIFDYLKSKTKNLQAIYDRKNDLKSVGDMKGYVANELRVLKSQQKLLEIHIGACEHIMIMKGKTDFEDYIKTEHSLLEGSDTSVNISYIEECIHKQFSIILTLKLMCLLSQTQEGLSAKDYKSLKKQFLHSHGFEHLVTLFNLKKLGLLNEQEGATQLLTNSRSTTPAFRKSNYKTLNKRFNLVPNSEGINLKSPDDMSYVFSGAYTPLPCRLIEQILTRDTMTTLQGTAQLIGGLNADIRKNIRALSKGSTSSNDPMRTIMVYFLGGCTFSEIAALRWLAKAHGLKVIIATTAIVTGNSLLESVMEKVAR